MKSRSLLTTVLACLCLAAANASAQTTNFYVGAATGLTKANDACDGAAAIAFSCDDSDIGWKVLAGYQFNKYLAVEVGYTGLGSVSASGNLLGVPVNMTFDGKGWEFLGVGSIPFNEQFSLYGKAGVFRWNVSGTLAAIGVGALPTEEQGTSFTFGAGLRYDFTKTLGARLEWQRYNDVGKDSVTGKTDVDFWSIGLVLKF